MIDCIIPAAGEGRRFSAAGRSGAVKVLAPFEGQPLILHVIGRALEVCERCIVVTGAYREAVEGMLRGIGRVVTVHNPHWQDGMISSIATAAAEVRTPWFFVAPADMPRLPTDVFLKLAEYAGAVPGFVHSANLSAPQSISPRYKGQPGHPVLISTSLRGVLLEEYRRFASMRRFLDGFSRAEVDVDDEGVVFDVDTPV